MYTTSTPYYVRQEKFQRVRFVTANTKTLKDGRRGMEEYREEGSEEAEGERLLHLSQVRLGSQGRWSPFPSPRLRAEEAAGTEKKKNLNDKMRRG